MDKSPLKHMQTLLRENTMPANNRTRPKIQKHPFNPNRDFTFCAAPDCDERIYRFMKERWGKKYHSDECQEMTAKWQREQRKREKWEKQSELEKAKKTLH